MKYILHITSAVPLVEITEIREGWKTDTFNKVSNHSDKIKEKGGGKLSDLFIFTFIRTSFSHREI